MATARRNLVHRIDRFFKPENDSQPSADALDNLAIALACLEREDHPGGEDAMMLAEKGWPPRFARTTPARPRCELMEAFERIRAGE